MNGCRASCNCPSQSYTLRRRHYKRRHYKSPNRWRHTKVDIQIRGDVMDAYPSDIYATNFVSTFEQRVVQYMHFHFYKQFVEMKQINFFVVNTCTVHHPVSNYSILTVPLRLVRENHEHARKMRRSLHTRKTNSVLLRLH